jgi:hypothetical protein
MGMNVSPMLDTYLSLSWRGYFHKLLIPLNEL